MQSAVAAPVGVDLVQQRRGADHVHRLAQECPNVLREARGEITGPHTVEPLHRLSERRRHHTGNLHQREMDIPVSVLPGSKLRGQERDSGSSARPDLHETRTGSTDALEGLEREEGFLLAVRVGRHIDIPGGGLERGREH